MDQSMNCFNLTLSPQDAFAMADLGFERLNRKPNFSAKETQYIIDMVRKYKFVLNEKALDSATNERKREVWQLICDGINEMTPGVSRSVDEIRKRWQNLNCTARKEASKFKKYQIEGLAPPPVSNFSLQILGMADETQEDGGPDLDINPQTMKIEIDLANEDSQDGSIQDVPGFPSSPGHSSGESSKCENSSVSSVQDQVYIPPVSTPTSLPAIDDQLPINMPESSNNNLSKLDGSSQSALSSLQHSKFTSNGSLPHNEHDVPHTSATSRPHGSGSSGSLPSKPSSHTSNQGNTSHSRNHRNRNLNLSNDIQILTDTLTSYSSFTTSTTSTSNKSGSKQNSIQDGAKRRRFDDQSVKLHEELLASERDSLSLEREKLKLDREKLKMEQEQLAVEMQKILMEKEKLNLEKDVEREKLRMDRERVSLEMQQERQKLALERERLELARDQERAHARLEQERLDIEKEKMAMEQEKLALEISYWRRKLLQTRSSQEDCGFDS
ncbi:myb/SANT-like DNA-binding domain-containing protein 4 [Haliotis rufescens]|uniref:myb/SANT-like DNA-binding domain-containing protein 4 n=1 Tax=Haliotis rufescens TaxID=6454 RepID=UPI001EB069B9|nr:myb/SANT-like DNA-binding domain-containing protein 4 [Haliotis rufescens]